MYQSCVARAHPLTVTHLRTKPLAAKLYVAWGAEGDKESMTRTHAVAHTTRGGLGTTRVSKRESAGEASSPGEDAQSPVERPAKSSVPLVDGRRPGPGKISMLHGTEVEAVLAVFAESARAHRENARTGIEAKVATGMSEARSHVRVPGCPLQKKGTGARGKPGED